jgi:hypothetical protein
VRAAARTLAFRSRDHFDAILAWAEKDDDALPFLIEATLDLSLGADALAMLRRIGRERVTRSVERALADVALVPAAAHVAAELRLPVGAALARSGHPDAFRALAVLDPRRVLDAALAGSEPAAEALALAPAEELARAAMARRSAAAVRLLAPLRARALFDYFTGMLAEAPRDAIDALARLGDPRAVPHLIPCLDNPRTAGAALEALRTVTGATLTRRPEWERWWIRNRSRS